MVCIMDWLCIYVVEMVSMGKVHEYPEDIKEKTTLKEPTEDQKKQSRIYGGLVSVILFAVLALFPILYFRHQQVGFTQVFFYTWIQRLPGM